MGFLIAFCGIIMGGIVLHIIARAIAKWPFVGIVPIILLILLVAWGMGESMDTSYKQCGNYFSCEEQERGRDL